ncbi:MAG TPA: 4Fe-4S binding protein, partial [Candidatus Hydrogenedentes bacterium]|nr:4Fe-4S binding protein [Candidatus Hydrogenedentota bacterium]
MRQNLDKAFITTIKERCRVCYTCVRECPAKAIRIVEGQAEVIPARCIGCGNCVRVCSQQAKRVVNTTQD